MEWVLQAWRGKERCWKVFWIYGVLVGIIWRLLLAQLDNIPAASIAVGIAHFVYIIWLLVSQYRCAFNLDWKFWGYIVRILVLAVPVMLVVGLLLGGVLKGQNLVHVAQCKKVAADAEYRKTHEDIYERCQQEAAHPDAANDRKLKEPPTP